MAEILFSWILKYLMLKGNGVKGITRLSPFSLLQFLLSLVLLFVSGNFPAQFLMVVSPFLHPKFLHKNDQTEILNVFIYVRGYGFLFFLFCGCLYFLCCLWWFLTFPLMFIFLSPFSSRVLMFSVSWSLLFPQWTFSDFKVPYFPQFMVWGLR